MRDTKSNCSRWRGQQRAIITFDGKMQKSKLTKQQISEIHEENMNVQNQLGIACTFCGNTNSTTVTVIYFTASVVGQATFVTIVVRLSCTIHLAVNEVL